MKLEDFRNMFPQLGEKVYGKDLVYLDSAATSLRPQSVVDLWNEMSLKFNANIHRAVHHTADVATGRFEDARKAVAAFIGADPAEIVFTSGTTASANLLAFSFGEAFVHAGDEIIVAASEHHSDLVPWQMLCERKGAAVKVLPVDENGRLEVEKLEALLSDRTRLVCVAQISNVLGLVNPVKEIVVNCHAHGCPVFVDGAQGVVHCPVDVRDLDCDFYAFSGHKIYAAPGTGVLYGKKKWLEAIPPYMGGGEMIDTVSWEGTTYAEVPHKFEAGTQNFAGVPTLVPALALAREIRNSRELQAEAESIIKYVTEAFAADSRIRLYGVPGQGLEKIPLFSFSVKGAHHEDLALILDKMGIAVRSGHMCAEPLMTRYGVTGMVRASFGPYNTLDEAEYFIRSLDKAISMLV